MCEERSNLHRVPIETRYNLLKKIRFYVPHNCMACVLHCKTDTWSESDVEDVKIPFTKEQVHDMVDLLRLEPKSLRFDAPGNSTDKIFEKIFKSDV